MHRRKARWLKHLPRTSFSQGALYEIGSAMSFFAVKNYADEYLAALDRGFKREAAADVSEDESVGATAKDVIESMRDFVLKELGRKLKGYDLELFVADLLVAMGYRTRVSPHGGDSGIDIVALQGRASAPHHGASEERRRRHPGGDDPVAQWAMREGDYGLFVTLSDCTKNVQRYLDSTPIIRGIDGTELADLVLKYYKDLSVRYARMIPLKMVYIPVLRRS